VAGKRLKASDPSFGTSESAEWEGEFGRLNWREVPGSNRSATIMATGLKDRNESWPKGRPLITMIRAASGLLSQADKTFLSERSVGFF
jgi:hypothetical protein